MALKKFSMQLQDQRDGTIIQSSGGMFQVCAADSPTKVAIYDKDGGALANPLALNKGRAEFWTQDTVASVDICGIAPDGQWFTRKGVTGSGPNEINVDRNNRRQVALVPFSYADSTANTEKDSGFDLPAGGLLDPNAGIFVKDVDSGITIEFGTLSSESGGDADGIGVGVTVANAGMVALKSASTATRGALIGGGTLDRGHVIVAATQSISYKLSSGADTATGWLVIPYDLPLVF